MSAKDWGNCIIYLTCGVAIAYMLITLTKCTIQPVPEPNDQNDASELDAEEACSLLCINLERFDCPGKDGSPGPDEQYGTADDVPCAEQCVKTVSIVPWMLDKARCGAKAKGCDELEACD